MNIVPASFIPKAACIVRLGFATRSPARMRSSGWNGARTVGPLCSSRGRRPARRGRSNEGAVTMIEMSESINELATALSKAQARIQGAIKSNDNPEFGTRYADLAAVWSACRGALTKNGLSVVQFPGAVSGNFMSLTTMLMHSSGQWIRQALSIPLSRLEAQEYGAATTYARRYALAAVVGVYPQEEDSTASCGLVRRNGSYAPLSTGPIDEDQLATLSALAQEVQADLDALCAYLKVPSLEKLPERQYQAALLVLEQKRDLSRRAA